MGFTTGCWAGCFRRRGSRKPDLHSRNALTNSLAGCALDFGRRRELLDLPVVEQGDAVGEGEGFLLVVSDEDRGEAELVVDLPERAAKLAADLRVERSERLVEEEDARIAGEGSGERDALALAAGKLARVALAEALQLNEFEQLIDAAGDVALRRPRARRMTSSPKAMFRSTVIWPNNA